MTTYNTYAEAKIANPTSEIYWYEDDNNKKVFTNNNHEHVPLSYLARASDYCISVKDFLRKGYEFVDGDVYLAADEGVHFVGTTITKINANIKGKLDYELFVLSAKALEEKAELSTEDVPEGATHYCDGTFVMMNDSSNDCGWCKVWFEGKWHKNASIANCVRIEELIKKDSAKEQKQVEWKNGDIAYVEDSSHDQIKFIGLSGNKAVAVCECITSDRGVILDKFWVSDLLKEKPETPEQKKERELLEAAHELYSTYQSANDFSCMNINDFKNNFEKHPLCKGFLAIVKKTGYRKPE